jgi:hypothetical protein
VREDQILPHLAAVAILLARGSQANGDGTRQLITPAETAGLVDQLRTAGVTLTYDPDSQIIGTRGDDLIAVTRAGTADTPRKGHLGKGGTTAGETPAAAGGRARVTTGHAQIHAAMGY